MLPGFLSTDGHRLRRFFWGQDRPQVAGRESTSLIATTQWLAIVRVKALLGSSREGAKARSLVCGGLRSVGRDKCHLSGPRYARQKSYTVQRFMFTHEQGALIPIAIPIPIPIRTPPNCIVLTFGLY